MIRLRVASYNVHQCVGLDGRRDAARVAAVLREIDADFVGLQEVDARPGQGAASMQMHYLADALGLHAVAGPTIVRAGGHYGNALLSRRAARTVRHIDLTVYRREPRAAIDADFDVDADGRRTRLRVLVTHLGLLPGERRTQVRRLLDALGDEPDAVTVVCGDMNEWFAVGRPLRWLHARLGRTRGVPTFPAGFPLFALDRLWVHPRAALRRLRAHRTSVASDHLPVVADLEIEHA
jgi:endonuclease/exonuclease/phosphatase family metal-dependent hydrolase